MYIKQTSYVCAQLRVQVLYSIAALTPFISSHR